MRYGITTSIKQEGNEVRCILHEGKTLFSMRDLLTAGGITAPVRWIARARHMYGNELPMFKLGYPLLTKRGLRCVTMVFIDADSGKKIIPDLPCSSEARKWLFEDVLAFRFDENDESYVPNCDIGDETEAVPESAEPDEPEVVPANDLNERIDTIMLELLEIKKILRSKN